MATGTDNRKAVKGSAASDLKMERLKTPYTYTVNNKVYKYACSFDAIVAPDKLISNSPNNVLAEIDVAGQHIPPHRIAGGGEVGRHPADG